MRDSRSETRDRPAAVTDDPAQAGWAYAADGACLDGRRWHCWEAREGETCGFCGKARPLPAGQ